MIIGLTGGIGSGKSTIAQGLRTMGYTVYDTDREAKRIVVENRQVREKVESLLGKEVYDGNTYRTDLVAASVFNDTDLLARLNAIIHPAVFADIQHIEQTNRDGKPLFVECAILYESGLDQLCSRVVAIIASKKLRTERVMARDNTDIKKVRARIRAQMSNCQLKQKADIIVNNDGKKTIEQLCQYIVRHL